LKEAFESVVGRTFKEGAGLEKLLTKAHQDEDVLAVFLFGSVVREEQAHLSDIDLCIALVPKPTPFEPTAFSRKRLDYLKDFTFDIQIFQQLPLYVRRRVLKEGRILFVRDEALLYELAFQTARAFEDFRPMYLSYLEEMRIAGS
jgi:predicted nucleotidyltransferase